MAVGPPLIQSLLPRECKMLISYGAGHMMIHEKGIESTPLEILRKRAGDGRSLRGELGYI